MKDFSVTVVHTVRPEYVASLLCSAIDPNYGASRSWCRVAGHTEPTAWEFESGIEGTHWVEDYPLNPGGSLHLVGVHDDDDGVIMLDYASLEKGLVVLAEKYPQVLSAVLADTPDDKSSDVFLQCCLFGDVLYE